MTESTTTTTKTIIWDVLWICSLAQVRPEVAEEGVFMTYCAAHHLEAFKII